MKLRDDVVRPRGTLRPQAACRFCGLVRDDERVGERETGPEAKATGKASRRVAHVDG
jgi:hypothetical protein